MTRAWITGVGFHGGAGGIDETARLLSEGKSFAAPYLLKGVEGFPEVLGASAPPVEIDRYLDDLKLKKYMSPAAELGICAAGRALESAGLLGDAERLSAMALYCATGVIPFDIAGVSRSLEACKGDDGSLDLLKMGNGGLRRCHPLMPFKMLHNMALGLISMVFGIKGENFMCYPGPDQTAVGLDAALRGIRNGRIERALVGGAAQGLSLVPLVHLLQKENAAGTSGEEQSRRVLPDAASADMAAFIVVESSSSAGNRGRAPLAELCTVAKADDLEQACCEAAGELRPDRVVATGCEAGSAIQRLQGAWPEKAVPVHAFDSRLGHGGAASLAASLGLATLMAAQDKLSIIAASQGKGEQAVAVALISPASTQ